MHECELFHHLMNDLFEAIRYVLRNYIRKKIFECLFVLVFTLSIFVHIKIEINLILLGWTFSMYLFIKYFLILEMNTWVMK